MKIKLNIPETLSEITLAQYQKWTKIIENEEQLSTFYQHKMIEIFCKVELKQIMQMKIKDVDEIIKHLNTLFESKCKFKPLFNLGNEEFGFIPKLDDMTFGEYIDLDTYLADWQKMDSAMAILFRPVILKRKGKYLIEDYESSDKYDLRNMPLDVVMGSLVFFCNLRHELLKHILNYLKTQEIVDIPVELKDLQKSGDGINQFMPYHKEILEN